MTQQREEFEAWFVKAYHPESLQPMESGCYLNLGAGMAWDAWQAAQAAQPAQNHIEQYLEMVSTQPARVPWWMPIESAPKDGTRVLIKADCTVVAGWQNVFDDTFGWVVINDVWVPEHMTTHWQPLPAAPITKEQS